MGVEIVESLWVHVHAYESDNDDGIEKRNERERGINPRAPFFVPYPSRLSSSCRSSILFT